MWSKTGVFVADVQLCDSTLEVVGNVVERVVFLRMLLQCGLIVVGDLVIGGSTQVVAE